MAQNLHLTLTETYDLQTQRGKLGCIAVHTPTLESVNKKYPNLAQNFKSISYDGCNIVMACASTLPADPAGIGFESGQVAPEDMFNPFLHRAVSNESFNTIRNRMLTLSGDGQAPYGSPIDMVDSTDNLFVGQTSEQNKQMYYGLLASGGWRKAMPQQGIMVKGLYPIAYRVLDTYGGYPYGPVTEQAAGIDSGLPDVLEKDTRVSVTGGSTPSAFIEAPRSPGVIKGRPVKMPSFPLHNYSVNSSGGTSMKEPPTTYVWMMVTPPASDSGVLWYYRMRVTWRVTLHTLTSAMEYALASGLRNLGTTTYTSGFTVPESKGAEVTTNMVDAFEGTQIEQVM